jgi:hypothetical protein
VTVVGPSGIGKSSVVRAGLVPALRGGAIDGSERWLVSDLFPGAQPFEELAAALRRVAVDPAVVRQQLLVAEDGLHRCASGCSRRTANCSSSSTSSRSCSRSASDEDTRRAFLGCHRAAVTHPAPGSASS